MSNDKKFKGTPGPWDAHCMHGDARIGSNGEAIAVAPRHADQKNWPKSANARLIAAAPELLEALEMAVKSIGTTAAADAGRLGASPERISEHVAAATAPYRAAIAKALGDE